MESGTGPRTGTKCRTVDGAWTVSRAAPVAERAAHRADQRGLVRRRRTQMMGRT